MNIFEHKTEIELRNWNVICKYRDSLGKVGITWVTGGNAFSRNYLVDGL